MQLETAHKRLTTANPETPVRFTIIAASKEALERTIARHRHIQWTAPRRAQYGNAWAASGTYFVYGEGGQQ